MAKKPKAKAPAEKPKGLKDKRRAFAEQYIVDWNGKQAAIRAGYSPKSAEQQAYQLLQDPDVQAHIRDAQKRIAELAGISALGLALELKRIAFADLADYIDWDEKGVRLKQSVKVDGRAVAEVSETAQGVKVKLHDKLSAIDALAKMFGLNAPEKLDMNIVKSHEDALSELD